MWTLDRVIFYIFVNGGGFSGLTVLQYDGTVKFTEAFLGFNFINIASEN